MTIALVFTTNGFCYRIPNKYNLFYFVETIILYLTKALLFSYQRICAQYIPGLIYSWIFSV